MKLPLSDDMRCTRHDGVTRIELQQDGEDVAVLLVSTGTASRVVTGQVRALTADGYRMRRFAPMDGEPHITAYVLARPLRVAA